MLEYDREAEYLEHELIARYTKLLWHVSRAEERTKDPHEFFLKEYFDFQVVCELQTMTGKLRGISYLDRETYQSKGWDFICTGIAVSCGNALVRYLLSKE